MSEELIEELARAIKRSMGPVFGSPEYLADPVKRARAERRQWDGAVAYAHAMLPIIRRRELEAGEKVKEAGARENLMICLTNGEELTDEAMEMLNFAADRIRALDVTAIIGDSHD